MAHWRGLDRMLRRVEELGPASDGAMRGGLREAGEAVMTDVKASRSGKGVPVDKGTLRSTGEVRGPDASTDFQVWLQFGGPAAPYALRQHEDLTLRHEVGEARYLVRAYHRFQQNGGPERALRRMAREAVRKAQRVR